MNSSFRDNIVFYSHLFVAVIGALAVGYLFARYLLPLALPFIIAWIIAFAVRPLASAINKKIRLPERAVRPCLALLIIFSLIALVSFLAAKLVGQAWQLLSGLGDSSALTELVSGIFRRLEGFFGESEYASALEEHLRDALGSLISSLLSSVASGLTSLATSVPRVVIFIVVTVISSVYFSVDLEGINRAVRRILPERICRWCVSFKDNSLKIALRYLRSYLLIMLITFTVMLIGLLLLRVRYALLLALIIAMLDMLPVLGVGSFLIPWSLWNFLVGNTGLGIGILVLFAVAEIIRQLAEPKIIGKSLGIPPIITLILLYVSYTLFGVLGLLLMPIFAVVINTLFVKANAPKVE